ncbi:MAG: MazG nucleotide pyrophosphohydrolase domain-containing protein [Candidatus Micrarchaeota archaeon]
MKEFDDLRELAAKLRKECPWDKEQTLDSFRIEVVKEAEELKDAVDPEHAREEFGDVFMDLLFVAVVAEEQGLFTLEDALRKANEKMVRRHPWIFGDVKLNSAEEAVKKWNEIKEAERNGENKV